MKIFEYNLDEISTPTGTIYVRFREKVGEREMINGQIRNKYYLTAFAGFANAPEDLKRENALRNFSIHKAEDLVHMIKTIFSDKTFISVKKVVLYDDLTNAMQGPKTPVFKRNPYLLKFFHYVDREGGDKIQLVDKVSKEGPPKLMRPRKENPMKGKKIRDIPQGETKKTVTFTVGSRFYREIQNNLPNIMKYRGPNNTFVMPNDIFMAFRKQAEEKFPFADIKVQNRVATGEGINEGSDKSAHDCGIVDGYYGRRPDPHKYEMGQRIKLTDPKEVNEYMMGYKDDSVGSKTYEDGIDNDITSSSQPDHEASMAKGELYNTIKNAKELFHMIKDGENLEGWVASKITRAADYINTVHDYMMYEKQYNESMNEVAKWRKHPSARSENPNWDPPDDRDDDDHYTPKYTSKGDTPPRQGSLSLRSPLRKSDISQSGSRKGLPVKSHQNRLKNQIKSNLAKNESIADESGPASRSLCRSKKPDSSIGASNLASCVSQGLRAHKSGRADYVSGKQLRVGGKKIKGKAHGGPLPDYS